MKRFILLALPLAALGGCDPNAAIATSTEAYSSRHQVDANVARFVAYDGNIVYVLGSDGNLWRENGDYTHRSWVDANLMPNDKSFQPMDGTTVFVLGSDGKLWREVGDMSNRQLVDTGVMEFRAIDNVTVYVRHGYDSKLWRETGDSSHSTQVDDNVLAFAPIDASIVYVMGSDFNLWRETGDYTHRTWVDGNVGMFRPFDATTVFVSGQDHKLWRETGDTSKRSLVDSNVSAFWPMGTIDVYVRGLDGKLWREFNDWTNRDYVDENTYVQDARVDAFQPIYSSQEPYGQGTVYVLGSDGKLWREFMPYHGAPCTTAGNPVGQSGCCGGLEPSQIGICVTADPPGCGVTELGGAPPCCRNKAPCTGDGVCVTDPSNGYNYCTPRNPPQGYTAPCPGGKQPTLYGCKVSGCPYTDGNLAAAYFCSKDQAVAIEQYDNQQCTNISCNAL